MFFTRVGYLVAWLALVIGVLFAGAGAIPFVVPGIDEPFASRMITLGIIIAAFGIVLGVLTEIHLAMKTFHESIARWPAT